MFTLEYFILNVKPFYEEVLRNPTIKNIEILDAEIDKIDKDSLQLFQHYMLLPLVLQIDNNKILNKNEINVYLIKCIIKILKNIKIEKLIPFKTILVVLLKQIYDTNLSNLKPNLSEELKLSILQCIQIACKNLLSDILMSFYAKENKTIVAQIAFVCVHIISQEKYRMLRVEGIKTILSLFQIHDESDFSDCVLREQVSQIIFSIIPKIIVSLLHIICGEEIQGQHLIIISIKALGRILCLVFEDYNPKEKDSCISTNDFVNVINSMSSNNNTKNNIKNMKSKSNIIDIEKTEEWLKEASKKLKDHLVSLNQIKCNSNRNIRFQLAESCSLLIEKCERYLNNCTVVFIEILITLSEDDDEKIACLCKKVLIENKNIEIYEDVENLFIKLLIKLPRIICKENENEQLSAFSFLKGIITFLPKEQFKVIMCNTDTFDNFLLILISMLKIELNNNLLIEEYTIRDLNNDINIYFNNNNLPWKDFKHFTNEKIHQLIKDICFILNQSNVFEMIIYYLIDILTSDVQSCNEIILLLNYLLNRSHNNEIICKVLTELLNLEHWNLALHPIDTLEYNGGDSEWHIDRTEGLYESAIETRYTDIIWQETESNHKHFNRKITINNAKFNVLHISLLLEIIGTISLNLGANYQPFMLKTLPKILEKSGSNNYIIHSAGLYALTCLANALNENTITTLIYNYSDFISHYINTSLKREEYTETSLDVLSAVLNYSTLQSMSYLENIINTVLIQNSNLYRSNCLTSFLKVYQMFIYSIKNWSEKKIQEIDNDINSSYINNSNSSNINNVNNDSNEKIADENDYEENDTKLPKYIDMTINILKRCLKYISTKKQIDKIIVLEIINNGLIIIKNYENELLPIIHLVWHPLTERFNEINPIIIQNCFNLLITLVKLSKDFIQKRTVTDILPKINKFMINASRESIKHYNDLSYEYTQKCKLQLNVLKNYDQIIVELDINARHLDEILDITKLYLALEQPIILQIQCINFYKTLSKYDSTAIYVKIYNEHYNNCNVDMIIKYMLSS